MPGLSDFMSMILWGFEFICTPSSKANDTKGNVIAPLSDDAVMHAIHHLGDDCLQFQLHPLLFVHLIIVIGFWAVAL